MPPAAPAAGRWRPVHDALVTSDEFENQVNQLTSVGYLQGYHAAPSDRGVTVHDPDRAHDGLNLYTSGHAPEAAIMDMQGRVLHRWTYDFADLQHTEKVDLSNPFKRESTTHWRRVHLCDNGDLLAIFDSLYLIRLGSDSNLKWRSPMPGFHHHMQVAEDGVIYALVAGTTTVPGRREGMVLDSIAVLSPDGKVIRIHSLLKCFLNSSYMHMLEGFENRPELFHTNTLQLLDGTQAHVSPVFAKGRVLVSMLYLNAIAVLDLERMTVVWALDGSEDKLWNGMHEPVLLDSGRVLIFDNNWDDPGIRSESRVIEFDPFIRQIAWKYEGSSDRPFYSRTCGTNQRLPNGNTLITESDIGRAFEVTRDGDVVWEYVNPHRAGKSGELIATLLHVTRIEADSVGWLAAHGQR